ncbi:MAG TPA: UpxY family transcription antiterminator [Terriglobales bacterium]|nr:UpxY family transcription antiterminator [Terriglobales bacterium]
MQSSTNISHDAVGRKTVFPGAAPSEATAEWYAAYTCARHEKVVAKQLEERGVDCFLPLYHSVRRWKDRRKEIDLPLFPGYVFVHTSSRDRTRVLQLPGVVRFVSFHSRPAVLPESEIEALRNGLAHKLRAEPHPYLKIGHPVEVIGGPMMGARGILKRKKDKYRLVLSLDLIMRSVAVEVDAADVRSL